MDFPKTKATDLTEEIMSDVRSNMKLDTWHYNRVFEAVYKVMEREFGHISTSKNTSGDKEAMDIVSQWFKS